MANQMTDRYLESNSSTSRAGLAQPSHPGKQLIAPSEHVAVVAAPTHHRCRGSAWPANRGCPLTAMQGAW